MSRVLVMLSVLSAVVGAISIAYNWLITSVMGTAVFRDPSVAMTASINGIETAGMGMIFLAGVMFVMCKFRIV